MAEASWAAQRWGPQLWRQVLDRACNTVESQREAVCSSESSTRRPVSRAIQFRNVRTFTPSMSSMGLFQNQSHSGP